tara:strand:+ start:330 stop:776 length:447 start_codon:yes stop_codon:yes gene_type:complete
MAKKGRNVSREKVAGMGTAGAATMLATGLISDGDSAHKKKMKNLKKTSDAQRRVRQSKISDLKVKAAQQKISQLERINEKNLSARDKKIRRELIGREKDIIKGAKPRTLASIASKVGLKTIPGVGAFLSLFASTPAYARGGNVNKKRR